MKTSYSIGVVLNKLKTFMESRQTPYEDGPQVIKLSTNESQAIKEFIEFLYQIIISYKNIKTIYVKEIFDVIFLLSRTYYETFLKAFEKKDYNVPFDQLLILFKDDFTKYLKKHKSLLEIQKIIQDYFKYAKEHCKKLKFKYINWYEKKSPYYISNYYRKFDLRNDIIPKAINVYNNTKWLLETPKAIREGAVFEANQAF